MAYPYQANKKLPKSPKNLDQPDVFNYSSEELKQQIDKYIDDLFIDSNLTSPSSKPSSTQMLYSLIRQNRKLRENKKDSQHRQ